MVAPCGARAKLHSRLGPGHLISHTRVSRWCSLVPYSIYPSPRQLTHTQLESGRGLGSVFRKNRPRKHPKPDLTIVRPQPTITLAYFLRFLELRLRAKWSTLGVTVLFVLGLILVEYGVQGLLDIYLGDSVFGAVCCMIAGLSMMLWVRLSGYRILNFWVTPDGR